MHSTVQKSLYMQLTKPLGGQEEHNFTSRKQADLQARTTIGVFKNAKKVTLLD
jgi:hypothetical protein